MTTHSPLAAAFAFISAVFLSAAHADEKSTVIAHRDLTFAEVDGQPLKLDIYVPKAESAPPLVVWIHGGGWRAGSKKSPAIREITDHGYALASISYRFSEVAIFPAQIHDCKAAIRWIRGNAKKYNLDANRIAVYGTSAGGHLVAMLGVSGDVKHLEGTLGSHTDQSSRVTAVANYFGPSRLLTMNDFPSRIDHNAADSPESILIGGAIQENVAKANDASPMTYVSEDDAPMLLVHGDTDPLVPINQSEILDRALGAVGISSTLVRVTKGGHGGFRNPQIEKTLTAFFAKHLLGESDVSLVDISFANAAD